MTAPRITRRRTLGLLLGLPLILNLPASAGADDAPALAGTWEWEWKDGQGTAHRHVLEVEGDGKARAARERFDELEPIKVDDLVVAGKQITFTVKRGDRRAEYAGTIDGPNTINGKVSVTAAENQPNAFAWTAKRRPVAKP